MRKSSWFFFLALLNPILATASAASLGEVTAANPPPMGNYGVRSVSLLSSYEFILSCSVLAFGLIILFLQFMLLRSVVGRSSHEVMRYYTVTLIIICSVVLVAAGLSDRQISPIVGLFGTIAGYILGKSERKQGEPKGEE